MTVHVFQHYSFLFAILNLIFSNPMTFHANPFKITYFVSHSRPSRIQMYNMSNPLIEIQGQWINLRPKYSFDEIWGWSDICSVLKYPLKDILFSTRPHTARVSERACCCVHRALLRGYIIHFQYEAVYVHFFLKRL